MEHFEMNIEELEPMIAPAKADINVGSSSKGVGVTPDG